MKLYLFRLIIGCLCIFLVSCTKCEDLYCDGASAELLSYISYEEGDSLIFINDIGKKESFFVFEKFILKNEVHGCPENRRFLGPFQEPCSNPYVTYRAHSSDTIRNLYDSSGNFIQENGIMQLGASEATVIGIKTINIYFNLFRINGVIEVLPLQLKENQALVSNFKAGLIEYDVVVEHAVDTSIDVYPSLPGLIPHNVSKIYFHRSKGIVAYQDIPSNSLFYLDK